MTTEKQKSYTLEEDEKATTIMVYTQNGLVWGDVISKKLVRVSTWLRTPTAPNYVAIFDCQFLYAVGQQSTPVAFHELHIPINEVLAYHMMPPAFDGVDYDEKEPNRKMEPVSILIGPFQVDGKFRMSSVNTLRKFMELATEKYFSFYDVSIRLVNRPNMKPVHAPMLLIRRDFCLVSPRQVG